MPLGVVVSGANAYDGTLTGDVLNALVIAPPKPQTQQEQAEASALPMVRGDGAYGNRPASSRAENAGFRMCAPKRGQTRIPGIGRVRSAVERGHALLSQFGRIARRLDRISLRYLAWAQLAACVIFIRQGFFR